MLCCRYKNTYFFLLIQTKCEMNGRIQPFCAAILLKSYESASSIGDFFVLLWLDIPNKVIKKIKVHEENFSIVFSVPGFGR